MGVTFEEFQNCVNDFHEHFRGPGAQKLEISNFVDRCASLKAWPNSKIPGVYAFFSNSRELLYVGKVTCKQTIGSRLGKYFYKSGEVKSGKEKHEDTETIVSISFPADRAFEATALEEFLICKLNPPNNKHGRSDR